MALLPTDSRRGLRSLSIMHSRQPRLTLEEGVQLKAFGHPGVLMVPQVLSVSESLILQHQFSIWLQEPLSSAKLLKCQQNFMCWYLRMFYDRVSLDFSKGFVSS